MCSITFSLPTWAALAVPPLTRPVEDLAALFSSEEKHELENRIRDILRSTGMQIQVLIIPTLDGESIEGYSIQVAEKWKLGDREKDEGLLLLAALQEKKIRVEVGRGLEGTITDLDSAHLIRNILTPAFKERKYYAGVNQFLFAVLEKFRKDNPNRVAPRSSMNQSDTSSSSSGSATDSKFLTYLVPGLVFLILIFALIDRVLQRHPLARGGAFAGISAPLSFASFSLFQFSPLIGIVFTLVCFVIGYVGLAVFFRLLVQILMSVRMSDGRSGGRGDDDDRWGGGGGNFSGGGSSGGW